jgi:hypothetical protein
MNSSFKAQPDATINEDEVFVKVANGDLEPNAAPNGKHRGLKTGQPATAAVPATGKLSASLNKARTPDVTNSSSSVSREHGTIEKPVRVESCFRVILKGGFNFVEPRGFPVNVNDHQKVFIVKIVADPDMSSSEKRDGKGSNVGSIESQSLAGLAATSNPIMPRTTSRAGSPGKN